MTVIYDHKKNCAIALAVCVAAVLLMGLAVMMQPVTLFQQRPQDHLSVHLILEMFAVVVSVMVVSIAWNTFSDEGESMAKALIYGFTVVAGSDMLHAITYAGMPSLVVDGSTSEGIFFWFSGRGFEVLTILLVVGKVKLPGSRPLWLGLGLLTLAVLFDIGTFALELLPATFIPGVGVTPFKSRVEYGLCAVNLMLAAWLFGKSWGESRPRNLWFATSCFVMGIGELAFTNYLNASDFLNVFGHFYKVAAYAFIYQATFLVGVRQPFELLARSEKKIRAQKQELNTLLSNLPVGVARLDQALNYRYVNPALASRLGKQQEELMGTGAYDVVSPLIRQQAMRHLGGALEGHRSEFDIEYTTLAGETVYAYVTAVPENYEEGGKRGVLAIFTDNTERELAQRKLNESLREISELKSALDAHAIVAVTDARGVITRVNDKFCSISRYPRSELLGRTHGLINSGHHPRAFFQDLWRTISRGEVWNGEICNRAKDGSLYWVYTTIVPFVGVNGVPEQYVAIRADITKRKEAEQEAQRMAFHDALTGLPNRRLMNERLKHAIRCASREGTYGALLLMDMDYFKEVNDTLGHALGDELLRQVSGRLVRSVRHSDTIARLGGDEFVVILEDLGPDLDAATARTGDLGEKIRGALAQPYELQGQQVSSTPSVGVVLFHCSDDNPDELIKQADMALYKAKGEGRNCLCFFDPSLQADITARALMQRDLRVALEHRELCLHYQPVVDVHGEILGVEALIRWIHPQRGTVSPAAFIPLAEQTSLILPIGQWVLETACNQLREWESHAVRQNWTIAVNVSAKQLNEPEFVDNVERALTQSGARPSRLRLELTESMLHDNLDTTIAKMKTLRAMGVRFSLDDFGTGYSSLSYLKRLPLEQLKIDKSFVEDVLTDESNAAITRTIMALADNLNVSVVAEGVETVEQMNFLLEHGCKAFQGYLFSRPGPVDRLADSVSLAAATA